MRLLWGWKVTFHRVVPSVSVLLLKPSWAVLHGTEFVIRWGDSHTSDCYSILPLRSPSSFHLVRGKGSKSFPWADIAVCHGHLCDLVGKSVVWKASPLALEVLLAQDGPRSPCSLIWKMGVGWVMTFAWLIAWLWPWVGMLSIFFETKRTKHSSCPSSTMPTYSLWLEGAPWWDVHEAAVHMLNPKEGYHGQWACGQWLPACQFLTALGEVGVYLLPSLRPNGTLVNRKAVRRCSRNMVSCLLLYVHVAWTTQGPFSQWTLLHH